MSDGHSMRDHRTLPALTFLFLPSLFSSTKVRSIPHDLCKATGCQQPHLRGQERLRRHLHARPTVHREDDPEGGAREACTDPSRLP
jgi:hypothetical protein